MILSRARRCPPLLFSRAVLMSLRHHCHILLREHKHTRIDEAFYLMRLSEPGLFI